MKIDTQIREREYELKVKKAANEMMQLKLEMVETDLEIEQLSLRNI